MPMHTVEPNIPFLEPRGARGVRVWGGVGLWGEGGGGGGVLAGGVGVKGGGGGVKGGMGVPQLAGAE